jgi:hypothetical protein
MKIKAYFLIIPLIILTLSLILLILSRPAEKNYDIRSKAASGNTVTVCPEASTGCSYVGGEGLQKAVDEAKEGDTVQVSGTLTNRQPTVDTQIKYQRCLLNMRGKNITLKGPAKLYGENRGFDKPDGSNWDIGICSQGGNFTIDGIQIMQTLRPGFYFQNSKAVLKNVSTNDIDNANAEFVGGSVAISNSIFGGGATVISRGGASIRMINNTISTGGTGLSVDLCGGEELTAYLVNNIIKLAQPGYNTEYPDPNGKGIEIKCPEKIAANNKSKIANNMIWKGAPSNEGGPPGQPYGCATGEYCEGSTFADPEIIDTTVFGDIGWSYGINWDLKPDSPALTAGDGGTKIGATGNACAAPNSDACKTLNSPLTEPSAPQPTTPPEYPTSPPENPTNPPSLATPTTSQPTSPPGVPTYTPIPPNSTPPVDNNQPTPIYPSPTTPPTPTPTPKPLIDVKKTVETVQNTWNLFVASVIHFTQTVLP